MVFAKHPMRSLVTSVLLVILVALMTSTAVSILAIRGHIAKAESAYSKYKVAMVDHDFASALSSITGAAVEVADITDELHSWQWCALSIIPVLGDEIQRAQELSRITERLASGALIPVASDAAVLIEFENDSDVLSLLSAKLDGLANLYASLDAARGVVSECRMDVENLAHGRLQPLNNLIDKTRDAVANADDTFDQVDVFFDTADTIGLVVNTVF